MNSNADDILDTYLLMPCMDENCNKKKSGGAVSDRARTIHSVEGWFEIDNKPLRVDTILFIGDYRKMAKALKKRENLTLGGDLDKNFGGASGLTFPCERGDGSSFVVIWMDKFDWSILDIETLSHECLHAAVMVMRLSGTKAKIFTAKSDLDVDDEGLAYRQATTLSALLKKLAVSQSRKFRKVIGKRGGKTAKASGQSSRV